MILKCPAREHTRNLLSPPSCVFNNILGSFCKSTFFDVWRTAVVRLVCLGGIERVSYEHICWTRNPGSTGKTCKRLRAGKKTMMPSWDSGREHNPQRANSHRFG